LDLEPLGGGSAPMAVARYRLDIAGRGGEIQVAIPQAALAPMRDALAVVPKKEKPRPVDTRWTERVEREITRSRVTLTAVLEERMMMLGEVVNLEVGQILQLVTTADTRIRIECNGERMMWCHLGKTDDVYTLSVDDYVNQEQEFMDEVLSG